LVVAAEVFAEMGYAAASTQQIADRASTAIGSIYQFFPNKLAIFHALEVEFLKQREDISQEFFGIDDVSRPLKLVISEYIDGFAHQLEHPVYRCIWLQFFQPHVSGLFAILQDSDERFDRQLIAESDFFRGR
jgi:AcrR family transcriptional regulator